MGVTDTSEVNVRRQLGRPQSRSSQKSALQRYTFLVGQITRTEKKTNPTVALETPA
jgi:hypothetical protein